MVPYLHVYSCMFSFRFSANTYIFSLGAGTSIVRSMRFFFKRLRLRRFSRPLLREIAHGREHLPFTVRKSCTPRVARETKNIVFTQTKKNCLLYSLGHFSKKWSSNVVLRHIASRQKHPETNSNHSRPLSSRGESQPTRYSFRVPEQRSHAPCPTRDDRASVLVRRDHPQYV